MSETRTDPHPLTWLDYDAKGAARSDADRARLDDAIAWFVGGAITVRPGGNGGTRR